MYLLNNLKFDVLKAHTIDDTQYPQGWFLDAANRVAVGIVEVPDPVRPDASLFEVIEGPDGSITSTPYSQEYLDAVKELQRPGREATLWQAAHNYEFAQISGSAIGLLAMGVMTGKPKCIAVQNWIKGIWTTYYTRKATGSTDYDFSVAGLCPHTVPELMEELGV